MINFEVRKLLVENPIGEILDLPGRINAYFWLAFNTSAFISKCSEKAFFQTSLYCPQSKISSYGLENVSLGKFSTPTYFVKANQNRGVLKTKTAKTLRLGNKEK